MLAEVTKHPWVTAGNKTDLELELPMKEVVQTHIIPTANDIDPDVLSSMTSLGCFKDREKLVQDLLCAAHNTEKVIYFLLLDRKRRKPSYEDETEIIIRNRSETGSVLADPPRKRVDTCQVNGRSGPRYSFDLLSDGSPLTPRRYPYGSDYISTVSTFPSRTRRGSATGSSLHASPAASPLSSPKPTPRGTPEESPLNTPPGSPSVSQPYWKSRLNTLKNSFLGSPRFHRRKLQVPSASDEVSLTPDSSPELTKRSWFGSLMSTERDESHVILVKDRPLSCVKADLIHAFLSIADLSHSVVSPMSFRVEYKRPGGPTMFQRNIRFHVDITAVSAGPISEVSHAATNGLDRFNNGDKPSVYCISFTLISGPIRRFKRICEHIQAQILGRRPNMSPRISRRPTAELSDSSSCGSESLSPTPTHAHVASDDMALGSGAGSGGVIMARCKSDQDATADIFEREAKLLTQRREEVGRHIANGRRMSYDTTNRPKDKV